MLFHDFCEGGVRELLLLHILHFLLLNRVVVLFHYFRVDWFLCTALIDMREIRHEFSIVSEGLIGMLPVLVLPLS